jgi:hypothetical protein
MWAWSEYAEAWGYSFSDKDPPPRGSDTDEIVLLALLLRTSAGGR